MKALWFKWQISLPSPLKLFFSYTEAEFLLQIFFDVYSVLEAKAAAVPCGQKSSLSSGAALNPSPEKVQRCHCLQIRGVTLHNSNTSFPSTGGNEEAGICRVQRMFAEL